MQLTTPHSNHTSSASRGSDRPYVKMMGADVENNVNHNNNHAMEDNSALKKKRKRRPKSTKQNGGGIRSYWPTELVCSASSSSSSGNNHKTSSASSVIVEWGVVVSIAITLLFGLGCYQAATSLPDPDLPSFGVHVGENWNMMNPRHDWETYGSSGVGSKGRSAHSGSTSELRHLTPSAAEKSSSTIVPPSKWPVSLRQEDESTYDTIVHPGDGVTVMKVPPFWSKPVHNGGLISRETAMQIGSCTESPYDNNHSIGDACPVHQRTIYVGIASYRDFECRSTVESIFLRAEHPDRIRVGVVDQIVNGEDPRCDEPLLPCAEQPDQALCKYADQVDVYEMAAELSIGPVFARHIGYRLYRGEYYATQSDAHVTYTTNWDSDIILQMEESHNEMAVLSTYLTDVQGSISSEGHSLRNTRPIMCNTIYEGGAQGMHLRHGSQPERIPTIHGSPQLQPWWAAGYSFSRGHFIVNVPYDWLQPMIFQGEEMSIGIRGYTIGYDFYAPQRSVCFHHYAVGKNLKLRNKVHHFWENDNKYAGTGKKAMARLLGFVHMNPEVPQDAWDHVEADLYGIGGVRTPEQFYDTFGIDVVGKTVQGHLCQFVDTGKMHNEFTPHLRKDGMGIDYTDIHYRFKDPAPNQQ